MIPRLVERRVRESLADTRVVLLCGPRQSGKTTLARWIAGDEIPFLDLDDLTTLRAARADPVGFLRGYERAVIDEIQRVPDLLLAIKSSVDADPRPGRFLLTGSANLMTLPRVADSLAGRIGLIRLLPLSQAELRNANPTFLDKTFAGELPTVHDPVVGDDLVADVLAGGYPEALARSGWQRKQDWHLDYIEAIVRRDLRDVAGVERSVLMPRLLRVLAEHSGQLINYSGAGAALDMNHVTTKKYFGVLESLFLVHSLSPWHTNTLKRLTKTAKLHFLDAGLLGALRGITPDRVRRDRQVFGPILETFALGELLKLATASGDRYEFLHFRDKDRKEVDIVVENRIGEVVGIELKAAATVSKGDFAGLRRLAQGAGESFRLGVVLYDHDRTVRFGERMAAVPISTLWS